MIACSSLRGNHHASVRTSTRWLWCIALLVVSCFLLRGFITVEPLEWSSPWSITAETRVRIIKGDFASRTYYDDDAISTDIPKGDNVWQGCEKVVSGLSYKNQIEKDLAPFVGGISTAKLNKALHKSHKGLFIVHIRKNRFFFRSAVMAKNEGNQSFLTSTNISTWFGPRTRKRLAMLMKVACKVSLPDVDMLMVRADRLHEDHLDLPIFHFQKHQNHSTILIPYSSHLRDLETYRQQVVSTPAYDWSNKTSKLFWRGSTTNGLYKLDDWEKKPRTRLLMECNRTKLRNRCDAGFFKFVQVSKPEPLNTMQRLFELRPKIEMEDHNLYKYIAWLDGNGPCSGRSEKLVAGNSVLLKEDSQELEFFYSGLKPNVHYVSIDSSMNDLEEKLTYLEQNENHARAMVANSQRFAKEELSAQAVSCYVQQLLVAYSKLHVGPPLLPMEVVADTAVEVFPSDSVVKQYFGSRCHYPVMPCLRKRDKNRDDGTLRVGKLGVLHAACSLVVDSAENLAEKV